MKAIVTDQCIGCRLCEQICPEVFHVDGVSQVVGNADENGDKVVESAEACPVNAIELQ